MVEAAVAASGARAAVSQVVGEPPLEVAHLLGNVGGGGVPTNQDAFLQQGLEDHGHGWQAPVLAAAIGELQEDPDLLAQVPVVHHGRRIEGSEGWDAINREASLYIYIGLRAPAKCSPEYYLLPYAFLSVSAGYFSLILSRIPISPERCTYITVEVDVR